MEIRRKYTEITAEKMPPHLYSISASAYKDLVSEGED
jgi:myosin heavy subunit